MDPRDALDLTIRVHKLNATQLAEKAGLHKSELSRYRNKKQDLYGHSVFTLMQVLPLDAYNFFTDLLRNNTGEVNIKLAEPEVSYTAKEEKTALQLHNRSS